MNIDWGLAVSVILSGMVIVFIILIILICAVTVVSRALKAATRKSEGPKTVAPVPASVSVPAPKPEIPPVVQSGITEETVAVISAAVCAYADEAANGVSYAVRSVRRADGARPVWGFAGMRQNTRPF